MRRWRFLVLGLILTTAICCVHLVLMSPPDPGPIDRAAVKRIQKLCGPRTDCEVTLHDIFPGDWDTFYQFDYTVRQDEVSRILHTGSVGVSDLQEIYVFLRDGRVVRKGYGDTGQEQPIAGEIAFYGQLDTHADGWRRYPPSARFKVAVCPTFEGGKLFGPYGGTYYHMVLIPVRAAYTTKCDSPSG